MSGLDAFIPQPQDPADLPAALRKFAEWVEAQKTGMEATVRAEVAKVNQDTIAANVLAQIPATVAPFKIDIIEDLNTYDRGTSQQFSMRVPQGARSVNISARGGGYEVEHGKYLPAPWVHAWVDLKQKQNLAIGGVLGGVYGTPNPDGVTYVAIKSASGTPDGSYLALKAPQAPEAGHNSSTQTDLINAVDIAQGGHESLFMSQVILEWYNTVPPGAMPLTIR